MPELDYETNDLTGEWIAKLSKALNMPTPVLRVDGTLEQVEEDPKPAAPPEIPLDEVPLLDLDDNASGADKLKTLGKQIDKLQGKIGQAYDLAGTLQRGPYWSKFAEARDAFALEVERLRDIYKTFDPQRIDMDDLTTLEGDVFEAYGLYGEVEKVARSANKSQEDLLANLRSRSAKLDSEVSIQHSACAALFDSEVDTSAIETAHSEAQAQLVAMNTAINSAKIEEAENAYDKAAASANDLAAAVRAAKRAGDAYYVQMMQRAAIVAAEIKQAEGSRHAVAKSKRISEAFDMQHDSAQSALADANAAIEAGDYGQASQALIKAAEHQSNMYSLILRGSSRAGDDDDDEEAEEKISGSPEQKKIFGEASRLKREAARHYKQKERVKADGNHIGQFERGYQNIIKLAKDAQKEVVEKKLKEAEEKNKKGSRLLHEMERICKEVTSANAAIADQIELLKTNAQPSYDALREYQQLADRSEQDYNNYSIQAKLVQQFDELIEGAENYQKAGYTTNADSHVADAQQILKRMNFRAQVFDEYTAEEKRGDKTERLRNKIGALRAEHDKLAVNKGNFTDNQELKIFENFSDKTLSFLKDAETAVDHEQEEQASDHLENASVAIQGMMTAMERGINTAAKTNIFEADIDAMRSKIAALYDRRTDITYEKQLSDFLSYSTAAGGLVDEAETLMNAGAIKNVQAALSNADLAIGNMEACFIEPKGRGKGPKAKPADYDQATKPVPEEGVATDEQLAADLGTQNKAIIKMMQSVAKLRQKLGVAEASWRPECLPDDRPEFDALHHKILERLVDTEAVLGTVVDHNEAEVIKTAQAILAETLKLYGDMQALHRKGKAEATGEEAPTTPESATRAISALLEELKQLENSITTSYSLWAPKCLRENATELDGAKHKGLEATARGQDLAVQKQLDPLNALPEVQQAVSDAKANLSLMQKVFQGSENLKAVKLKDYGGRAAQLEAALNSLNEERSRFEGWSVNFSAFDGAYTDGSKAVEAFKAAQLSGDVEIANEKLQEADAANNIMEQALRDLDKELKLLKADYSIKVAKLQTRQGEITNRRSKLDIAPDQQAQFDDNLKLTNLIFGECLKAIENGTQAEADTQLVLLSDTMNLLEVVLASGGDLGVEALEIENYVPDHSDRLTQLRQVIQSAYRKRPELEQFSHVAANAILLKRFDEAFDAAEQYADLAERSKKPEDVERALTKGGEQTQIMFNALEEAKDNVLNDDITSAPTEEQFDNTLTNKIEVLLGEIEASQNVSDAIIDAEHKKAYDNFLLEAQNRALDAQVKSRVPDYAATEDLIENGYLYLKEASAVYTTALKANRDLEGMNATLNEAIKTIQGMSAKEASLNSQKKLNDFIRLRSMALNRIKTAQAAIKAGKITEVRPEMPGIESGIEAMKELFKSKRQKAKEFFTGKKSKSTDKSKKGRRK